MHFVKQMVSIAACAALLMPTLSGYAVTAAEPSSDVEVNFAKALQMSLYFYHANKCGDGITGGNLE